MMNSFQKNGIDFTYPNDWTIEDKENILSIYQSEMGVGALQFSFYSVEDNIKVILKDELEEYLADKYSNIQVQSNEKYAYYYAVDNKKMNWRYWLFLKNNLVIFATYNCKLDDSHIETKIVDKIIASIMK